MPRPVPGLKATEKIEKGTIPRLLKYMFTRKHLPKLIIIALAIVGNSLVSVVTANFMKILVDSYIAPLLGSSAPDFTPLLHAIVILASIYLCGTLCNFLVNFITPRVSESVIKQIRDEVFSKMQTLPLSFYDTHTHGDLMSVYTNDVEATQEMLSNTMPNLLAQTIQITSIFVSMIIMSPLLTLLVVLCLVLRLKAMKYLGSKSGKYFGMQQKQLGMMNGYVEEMTHGQKVVKVFNHEQANGEGFNAVNEELRNVMTKAATYANTFMPVMVQLSHLEYAIIAIGGGALAIFAANGPTLGVIVAFLMLSKNLSMPINNISQQFNTVLRAMAGAQRIFKMLDEKSEENDGQVVLVNCTDSDGTIAETDKFTGMWAWKRTGEDGKPEYRKLRGDVRFNNVHFSYVPEKEVLHDINIYAEPGQKIALVGSTGAGKTTIANLINRFYDIDSGEILMDGIDIRHIRKQDLRHCVGIVLQETSLFTGTIADNIRFGRLDATDEEVIAAAKLANADGFINQLPEGYNTVLNNGGESLSQGQRQLLAIARAAVANPPVMILDEATSSIDTRTESLIQESMDSLMAGRTTFVIAHRLSTVMNSDVIMVMEQGRIIERGTHDDLLAQNGRYAQLYRGKKD